MSAPTTGLPTLIVQSLQWSSLHYLACALALLCWASLRKQGPTCTLDITLTLCASEGIGEGVGVCEYVDVRSSGFLFKCSWDQFHWPGGWELRRGGGQGVSGDQKTYENWDKLPRSKVKVCWRCKSNLWLENTVLCFSPWFAQPLKSNLRTNWKYRGWKKTPQQILTLLCSLLVVIMLCVRLWLNSNQYVRGHLSMPFSEQG